MYATICIVSHTFYLFMLYFSVNDLPQRNLNVILRVERLVIVFQFVFRDDEYFLLSWQNLQKNKKM